MYASGVAGGFCFGPRKSRGPHHSLASARSALLMAVVSEAGSCVLQTVSATAAVVRIVSLSVADGA